MDLSTAYDAFAGDIVATLTLFAVTLAGLAAVVWDAYRPAPRALPWATAGVLLVAAAYEALRFGQPSGTAFYEMVHVGGYAAFVNFVILVSAAFSVMLSQSYLDRLGVGLGEVYSLMLFATAGMIVLATANNLVTVFVGLETMSICLYVMAGLLRSDRGGPESAIKYFVLGAFSTGFFLYGIALLYGATGTLYLGELLAGVAASGRDLMFWAGAGMLLVGFLFKVSAVPFHMWTPDVYQGTPTTLTGYMATASKTAAFASLILVLHYALPAERWTDAIAVVAAVTMILGNLVALAQDNVKRMLAYSSVAHAGYVLVGLASGTAAGYSGALYYLLVYAIMNVGAFGVMALLEWDGVGGREQRLDSLAGIGYRKPVLGVTMGFFMFSLTGFPPLGGFIGKYAVFAPAVSAGLTWLVVVGVLASAASAYYYLRVLYVFWMQPGSSAAEEHPRVASVPASASAVLIACALLLLVLGVYPALLDITSAFFASDGVAALR